MNDVDIEKNQIILKQQKSVAKTTNMEQAGAPFDKAKHGNQRSPTYQSTQVIAFNKLSINKGKIDKSDSKVVFSTTKQEGGIANLISSAEFASVIAMQQ